MKKIVVALMVIVVLISLCSCDLSGFVWGDAIWDIHQRETKVFYGVGDHIEELDNTCVLIPGLGHVAMPSLEDGTVPKFEKGDLIKIVFKNASSDFAIMESYPAQFGGHADEIAVLPADVDLTFRDDGSYLVTVDVPVAISELAVGDTIICKTMVPENNGKIEKDFARCKVESTDGMRMTLSFDVETAEMLEALMYGEASFVK